MSLLTTVVVPQPDAFILIGVMAPDRQDNVIDYTIVCALESRPPLFQAREKAPERSFVTFTALSIDQPISARSRRPSCSRLAMDNRRSAVSCRLCVRRTVAPSTTARWLMAPVMILGSSAMWPS
jgi:hypothetical protein